MAESYNPILSKEQLLRWRLFQSRPKPEPGVALVLSGDRGFLTIMPGQMLGAGELRWGNYNQLYRVDISEHTLRFSCDLPCASDAFTFHAEVQLAYSVKDPALIVQNNIVDVRQVLEPRVISVMRNVSRKYEAEQSGSAEQAIIEVLRELNVAGFEIKHFALNLSLEQEVRSIIRQKQAIRNTREIDREKQELEIQREKFDIEIQKIKMEFYGPIIREGNWQMLALQLAKNPDDVAVIVQIINQQHHSGLEKRLQLLKMLLDADVLEESQIGEIGKRLLQGLVDSSRLLGEKETDNNRNQNENKAIPSIEKKNDASSFEIPDFNYDTDG